MKVEDLNNRIKQNSEFDLMQALKNLRQIGSLDAFVLAQIK